MRKRVILDIDSSESPVHGKQEGATYNGHFECVCYHPLFCFNQFGDCEGAVLRPGNVHSADGWEEFIEPIVQRYLNMEVRLLFRADAAFAKPELEVDPILWYTNRGQLSYRQELYLNIKQAPVPG